MSAPVLAARRHRRWKGAGELSTVGVDESSRGFGLLTFYVAGKLTRVRGNPRTGKLHGFESGVVQILQSLTARTTETGTAAGPPTLVD